MLLSEIRTEQVLVIFSVCSFFRSCVFQNKKGHLDRHIKHFGVFIQLVHELCWKDKGKTHNT